MLKVVPGETQVYQSIRLPLALGLKRGVVTSL